MRCQKATLTVRYMIGKLKIWVLPQKMRVNAWRLIKPNLTGKKPTLALKSEKQMTAQWLASTSARCKRSLSLLVAVLLQRLLQQRAVLACQALACLRLKHLKHLWLAQRLPQVNH